LGYEFEYINRQETKGGGIGIYINEKIQYKLRTDLNIYKEGKIESCFVEIITKKGSRNIIIGEIYKVPGIEDKLFLDEYDNLLTEINKEKVDIVIGTDQNYDYLKLTTHNNTAKLLDINLLHEMLPTITKPTIITHSTATLIDNIYLSKKLIAKYKSRIIIADISDHLPCVTMIRDLKDIKETRTVVITRKYTEQNINSIKSDLAAIDWSFLKEHDVNGAYNLFLDILTETIDRHAPEKNTVLTQNKIQKPWITKGLIISSKECDKKFRKIIRKAKTSEEYSKYIKYRNKLNSLRRTAKKNYFANKFEEIKSDSKNILKLISQILGKMNNKENLPEYFNINGKQVFERSKISEEFCKFYTNIGTDLAQKIPNVLIM
jgi:hypothetical protein